MRVCADRAAQLRITGITEAGAALAAQAHDVDGERRIEQREDSEISCRDRRPLNVRPLSVLFELIFLEKPEPAFPDHALI
jgi:hypothetical protein